MVLNRLWFFSAGRYQNTDTQHTFTQTGGAFTRTETNKRGELKLTGTVAPSHTIQGSYINNATEQTNTSGIGFGPLVDASTLYTRQLPNHLFAVNYNGVLSQRALATVQYSHKKQARRNNGGRSTNILDSPFLTLGGDPRRARISLLSRSFLRRDGSRRSEQSPGDRQSHISGLDRSFRKPRPHGRRGVFREHWYGIGGNSQSPSGYVFVTDYLVQDGRPIVDGSGRPIPQFVPGVSEAWNFLATRGARVDIKTTSVYFQDRWVVTPRLTLPTGHPVRKRARRRDR